MNFKFFRKNDGTEINQNNYIIEEYHTRIEELEQRNTTLHQTIEYYEERLQHHASRVYPDIQNVRDEYQFNPQTIGMMGQSINDFVQQVKLEQVTRIAHKLLENNLIEHTIRQEEMTGNYISRLEINVQNIL